MKYVLENGNRYKWNPVTYEYEIIPCAETIKMAHEGRYITLKKDSDEKKEFRYDLSTGEFERINHYKTKDDKFTRTAAKNITSWFTDCKLVTEDEKFAKLYAYAKQSTDRRYSSHVRFIEMFATHSVINMEQWLSLGINFDKVLDTFNRLIGESTHYSNWRDHSRIYHAPNEYSKDVLKYIKEEHDKHGHISFRFVNECYDFWNNGQYEVLQKVEQKIVEEPQYRPVFMEREYAWSDTSDYVNILHHSTKASLRNTILTTIKEYNLDLDAFIQYALYLHNSEKVTLSKLMADYPDYLRRELHLKNGRMSRMDKYPDTWLSASHRQQEEYRALQHLERMEANGNTEKFDNSIEANRHLEWRNGNYFIRMPEGAEDIRDEADQMEHCVATYIPRIEAGETTVMFMRDKDHPEKSLVTVEVIDGAITQAYAHKDTHPTIACKIWLTKWANKKGLRITAITLNG